MAQETLLVPSHRSREALPPGGFPILVWRCLQWLVEVESWVLQTPPLAYSVQIVSSVSYRSCLLQTESTIALIRFEQLLLLDRLPGIISFGSSVCPPKFPSHRPLRLATPPHMSKLPWPLPLLTNSRVFAFSQVLIEGFYCPNFCWIPRGSRGFWHN